MAPRYACRKDNNHALIADAFRALGWFWIDTYQHAQYTPGFFDGLAVKGGVVLGVEIKDGERPLTPEERAFHAHWEAPLVIVRNIDDVLWANGHDWTWPNGNGRGR